MGKKFIFFEKRIRVFRGISASRFLLEERKKENE